jgi:hypothetical protein
VKVSHSQDVDAFLSPYPRPVRDVARAARRLIKDMFPGLAETVDVSARLVGYSFGPGYKGALFALIMSQTGVKLGIFRGSELQDPKGLMAGAGKVHRHVQLRGVDALARPGLKPLLRAAVAGWRKRNRAGA